MKIACGEYYQERTLTRLAIKIYNNRFNRIIPLSWFVLSRCARLRTNHANPLRGTELPVKRMLHLQKLHHEYNRAVRRIRKSCLKSCFLMYIQINISLDFGLWMFRGWYNGASRHERFNNRFNLSCPLSRFVLARFARFRTNRANPLRGTGCAG